MTLFLTLLLIASILSLTLLFSFQYYRMRQGKAGVLDTAFHDPLSEKQLENVKIVVTGQIREKGRVFTIILLKLTIESKKLMKRQFDRAIIKLSKMAFPKEDIQEVKPNRFLEVAKEEYSSSEK